MSEAGLLPRTSPGAAVHRIPDGWRLEIPGGSNGAYRLAQLDNYNGLSRRQFPNSARLTLRVQARVSANNLPGTWGFGLWNDPFGFSVGFGGNPARLPALPNVAWFFHASPENHLSLKDSDASANGFFAGGIYSLNLPTVLFIPALPIVPFLALRPVSRQIRRLASQIIRQEAVEVTADVTQWHRYSIIWETEMVIFKVDNQTILQTHFAPKPPLGLVLWLDNQYAAWKADGSLGYGTLSNPEAWMELKMLTIEQDR